MLPLTCSNEIAHSSSICISSFLSIVEASPSSRYGTAIAMIGVIMNLELMAGCQGRVALPPTMARVSMAAAGAMAVNTELWMILEDFLRAYEETLRMRERKDSPHVLLLPWSMPYFLTFSMMRGVLISKYN